MAVLDAPPGAVRPAGGEAPRPARLPRVLDGRFLVPFSLGAAALSLLVVRSPTYDVWAWLVWGREIAHLDLDTSHGPQFKPLPVAVAAISSALGDSGIVLVWMVLARAGAVLAVGAVARVAWRAAGPGAAVLASLSLITVHLFTVYLAPYGMSEPMLVACVLWAVERHYAGRFGQAFLLLVAGSLLRVEAWPFLLLHAVVLLRRRQVRPTLLVAGLLVVPAAWFLPEWWGSGHPLRRGNGRAAPDGPLTKSHPGVAVLGSVADDLLAWVWVGAVLGGLIAIRERSRLLLGLMGLGAGWLALVAVMSEAGKSSGVSRYLVVVHAVAAILAGVGWVSVLRLVRNRLRPRARLLRAGPALAVALLAVPSGFTYERWLHEGARDVLFQQDTYVAVVAAVDSAGGWRSLRPCYRYTWTTDYRQTEVAWLLHAHLSDVTTFVVPGRPRTDYVGPMVRVVDRLNEPMLPEPFDLVYRRQGAATVGGVPAQVLSPC